jgi:hypothetical protein
MKQLHLGQFNLGRLRSYLLSGLAESHAPEGDRSNKRISSWAVA